MHLNREKRQENTMHTVHTVWNREVGGIQHFPTPNNTKLQIRIKLIELLSERHYAASRTQVANGTGTGLNWIYIDSG